MPRNVPITPEKEAEIIAALEKDSHASRVARTLGNVSYATGAENWRNPEHREFYLSGLRLAAGKT
jgi:hypothetical protein